MNASYYPLNYIEPLFRPPSEANSLILQVTNGCSWNQCAFCEMYTEPQKRFSTKKEELVKQEIARASALQPDVRRIFLADGDAMVLSTRRLLTILEEIKNNFPSVSRVSAYCLPRNVRNKSLSELQELRDAGLGLVYVGAESGDDELLALIKKGETYSSTVESMQKLSAAGIKTSVMLLNGLGGQQFSEQHARRSAALMNEVQPNYLATLVISFPLGKERFLKHFSPEFTLLDQKGLFREMELLLENLELKNTIFRSDHSSNYLSLKGVLGKDRQAMLDTLRLAINDSDKVVLREEWQRGL